MLRDGMKSFLPLFVVLFKAPFRHLTMKNKFKLTLAALALAATGLSSNVSAGPITVDGGWTVFYFGDAGSSLVGEPFTFTLSQAGTLTVTDALCLETALKSSMIWFPSV